MILPRRRYGDTMIIVELIYTVARNTVPFSNKTVRAALFFASREARSGISERDRFKVKRR